MIKYFVFAIFLTQLIYSATTASTVKYNTKEALRVKDKFQPPHRIKSDQINSENDEIVIELAEISAKHNPVNLGYGFSNFPISKIIANPMSNAVLNETAQFNQYTPTTAGLLRLRQAISQFYSPLIYQAINAENEVLITSASTSALYLAIQSHIDDGDEVIIIEPYYSAYPDMVKYVGGIPKYVSLRPTKLTVKQKITSSADWKFDWTELEQAFNSKTKMLILNNPVNPLGKLYTRYELNQIAALCQRWNVIVLSDEVYEFLPLGGRQHIRISSLPGMWERTITVGSASKAFSVTGWRIGWAYGPSFLLERMYKIQEVTLLRVSTPAQEAVAIGFENEMANWGTSESILSNLPSRAQEKVDSFINVLYENDFAVIIPEAGFFIIADWSPLENRIDLSQETGNRMDYKFLKWFARNIGILGQPLSFTPPNAYLAKNLIRLCVFRNNETLNAAAERLLQLP